MFGCLDPAAESLVMAVLKMSHKYGEIQHLVLLSFRLFPRLDFQTGQSLCFERSRGIEMHETIQNNRGVGNVSR